MELGRSRTGIGSVDFIFIFVCDLGVILEVQFYLEETVNSCLIANDRLIIADSSGELSLYSLIISPNDL
jgi:hypothetical protein